jgi:CRISPR-associated endoribonuclease Cas6
MRGRLLDNMPKNNQMRIHLKLTKNKQPVPFEYNAILAGIFHKWINDTDIHDNLSLYSFSGLRGGGVNKGELDFPKGGEWFISAYNSEIVGKIIRNIKKSSELAYGMKVKEIIICETPKFSCKEKFMLATPVFIKRTINNKSIHYLYSDLNADELMTETMKKKLNVIGVSDDSLQILFDRQYEKSKVKLISYKGIKNKVNWCPVIMHGKPETIEFAWNVGIGNSTGIGFGALI